MQDTVSALLLAFFSKVRLGVLTDLAFVGFCNVEGVMKKIIFFLMFFCSLAQAASTQTAPVSAAPTQAPPKPIVVCYKEGMGLDQLTQCAEQGDANAQLKLGTMLHEGQGITRDYKKGFEWTLKAAHQGNANAQYLVGVMFTRGSGTRLDYDKAFQWYSAGAEQGDANAQRSLGAIYYKAEGVFRDYVKSYMWINLASIQGDDAALKFRDTVVNKLSSAQLTQAQQMTSDWLAKHPKK